MKRGELGQDIPLVIYLHNMLLLVKKKNQYVVSVRIYVHTWVSLLLHIGDSSFMLSLSKVGAVGGLVPAPVLLSARLHI